MDKETYEKCKGLIRQIDDISNSAQTLADTINQFQQDENGRAEFVIYTGGERIMTALTYEDANKIAAIIHETYAKNISENKDKLNKIINTISSDLAFEAEKMSV